MSRRAAVTLALVLLMVLAGSPRRRARGSCRCGSGSLEIVLVLDTTSSMHVVIGTVKEQLYRLISALEGSAEDLRVGAVIYRSPEAPEYVIRSHALTSDRKALVAWLKRAKVRGGGHEAVEQGLERAVTGMKWTKGARKVIILVGDEAPHRRNREKCLKLARLAKSRGIAVNTITCSMTAWSYWRLTHAEEWKERHRRLGDKAKSQFELPIFQQIARNGGGMSVPSKDTKELLKWLLVISSGQSDIKEKDVRKFMEWDPAKERASAGRNPMLAQLRHRGEWNTPRNFEALRAALGRRIKLDFDSGREVVKATDDKLGQRPLLYLTGHAKLDLSAEEKAGLKKYLAGGGLLWADCCCARKEFDASLRALITELFPGRKLRRLAEKHSIYRAGYVIEKLSYARRPRTRNPGFTKKPPRLEGLYLGERLAVVYSPDSLGCGWASYPLGRTCQLRDADALKLSMNILLYALTRQPPPPKPKPKP
jgi:Domain of unknown function (DUF4159)/von Willebrand factor type A domain